MYKMGCNNICNRCSYNIIIKGRKRMQLRILFKIMRTLSLKCFYYNITILIYNKILWNVVQHYYNVYILYSIFIFNNKNKEIINICSIKWEKKNHIFLQLYPVVYATVCSCMWCGSFLKSKIQGLVWRHLSYFFQHWRY
jgi:DNA-directed RNA polymerase subunit RPC12/RpoP